LKTGSQTLPDAMDTEPAQQDDVNNVQAGTETSFLPVPSLIELTDNEKFRAPEGTVLDIEVRGERHPGRILFRLSDVSRAFGIPNIQNILHSANTTYERGKHYNTFWSGGVDNVYRSKTIFLTYLGLVRVLIVSRTPNADHFQQWAIGKLFTSQFGTREEREEMSAEVLNLEVNVLRDLLNRTNLFKFPAIYLVELGRVKDVGRSLSIPDGYMRDPEAIVAKFGRAEDLGNRLKQLQAEYGKVKNVQLRPMETAYVDVINGPKAEADIATFFSDSGWKPTWENLGGMTVRTEELSDGHMRIRNRKELAVIPQDRLDIVKRRYEFLRRVYAGAAEGSIREKTELEARLVAAEERAAAAEARVGSAEVRAAAEVTVVQKDLQLATRELSSQQTLAEERYRALEERGRLEVEIYKREIEIQKRENFILLSGRVYKAE